MSLDLDHQVRAALEARRGEWRQIAATKIVSHSWISQFVRGLIPNPGYETLKQLHEHMAAEGSNSEAGA